MPMGYAQNLNGVMYPVGSVRGNEMVGHTTAGEPILPPSYLEAGIANGHWEKSRMPKKPQPALVPEIKVTS